MAKPAPPQESMDRLNLGKNEAVLKLIETEGEKNEKVLYSAKIQKINRKGKNQARLLMITNCAIYNLKPKKFDKSKRRVDIDQIGMVTLSALSPEFAVHVPSEYDYHFASKQKDEITELLKNLYSKATGSKLLVVYSEFQHLKDIILTKKLAKFEHKNSKHAMSDTITSTKEILQDIDDQKKNQESSSSEEDV